MTILEQPSRANEMLNRERSNGRGADVISIGVAMSRYNLTAKDIVFLRDSNLLTGNGMSFSKSEIEGVLESVSKGNTYSATQVEASYMAGLER